jgi:hypothetical protein
MFYSTGPRVKSPVRLKCYCLFDLFVSNEEKSYITLAPEVQMKKSLKRFEDASDDEISDRDDVSGARDQCYKSFCGRNL